MVNLKKKSEKSFVYLWQQPNLYYYEHFVTVYGCSISDPGSWIQDKTDSASKYLSIFNPKNCF